MSKRAGRQSVKSNDFLTPGAVTGLTATDVGLNRPYLNTANTTSALSAANTGGAVSLSWTNDSARPAATSYTITTTPSTYTVNASAPATSYTFEGLKSDTSYTFSVVPVNAAGNGDSTTSSSVTATTVPDVPTSATATAGVNANTISWTAPASTGGKAISNYFVLGNDTTNGNTNSGSTLSIVISDTAGTSQYYNVYADNANGRSLASANSNTVTTLSPSFFSPPFFPPFFPPSFFSPPFFPPFFPPSFFSPPFFPPGFSSTCRPPCSPGFSCSGGKCVG